MERPGDSSGAPGARILIGTSGYSYKDWVGPFYPSGYSSRDMLGFYAREFSFTEINSTYYRLPTPGMIERMSQRVPDDFVFALKAFQGITHEAEDCERLRKAVQPLIDRGKLGAILIQFPYSFRNDVNSRDYLARVRDYLRDVPLAAEFRNSGWEDERTWDLLRELEIAYVCVDGPRLKGLPKPITKATAPFGYVRFHGRNAGKWWNHEQAYERYDYLYSERELKDWVPPLLSLSKEVTRLFVAFNNHFNGQSVKNARMLREYLRCPSYEPSR